MHSACPGYTLLGPALATYRTDQQHCQALPLRCNQAASFHRTANPFWRRTCALSCFTIKALDNHEGHCTCCDTGNRRKLPAVLATCYLIDRLQTFPAAKPRARRTRLNAFQYDYLNPPELSTKPLAVLKRRLYHTFPILANEELVSRVAWTLMVIAIARFGQQLRLPYLDASITPQDNTACMLLIMHTFNYLADEGLAPPLP